MKESNGVLFMILLLSARASSNEILNTHVISLSFCESSLPPMDKMGKENLKDLHTYAELKYDPHANLPDSFTICSNILITHCLSVASAGFFNIFDNNGGQFLVPQFTPGSVESRLGLIGIGNFIGKVLPLFPNQWIRSCMAVNATSGLIRWVVDGTLVLDEDFVEVKNSKSRPKDLKRNLVLGAQSYGGSWTASSQKVTKLEVFSTFLTVEKMERITRGDSCEEGDYLAWGDTEWILHGQAKIETIEKEETCEKKPLVDLYYIPFPDGMDSCMRLCENMGTRVPSVASFEEWTNLQAFLKKKLFDKRLNTLQIWLPIYDRETEGTWKDFYTGEVLQNYSYPWFGSKSDGEETENCARLLNENSWGDKGCDDPNYACMCSHKSAQILRLRGLCPRSAVDVHYKQMNKQTDIRELKLQGLTHSSIEYSEEENIWRLNVIGSNVTGISTASSSSFTLGKHNWTIKGDKGCRSGDTYITELKMSGCEENEFTCDDGQCVRMDLRCSHLPDCRDKSDEENCNILIIEDRYKKKIPPYSLHAPVNVSVSIELLRIVDINEEGHSIDIQFDISLMWKDNRVTFLNLRLNDSLNVLTEEDIDKLWLPKLIYENTDQKETTRLAEYGKGEWETEVIVRCEEKRGEMSGLEYVDESEKFKGSENSFVMNQTYTHTFQCDYKHSYYPFDTQVSKFYPPHIQRPPFRFAL